ncbi:TBC1 domain family member 14-like [Anneissia japonica]|uniref:TBC1 domain family member 14-like n=1 Tax=Anneissia japonica TaxID=1529436 RepID=UPI0014258CDA|nr:TBC1 domain family member 14-like [Anneissia japonica]
MMKEHRKVDNDSSKIESTKLGQQESRKPSKQSGKSTPMIFTSTWPIFKFKGRTSDKKTLRNSRNGKLKKGQKSKSGDEDADFVHDIQETLDHPEQGQISSSKNERSRPKPSMGNVISSEEEANEGTTVKYDVQDQVMRVCTHALNGALNSCCLSAKEGYESDDRQSCEEYGTAIDNNVASRHCKEDSDMGSSDLRTNLQENDCIQCTALSLGSIDKLQGGYEPLSRPNSDNTNHSFRDVNYDCLSNQSNLDENIGQNDDIDDGTTQNEPATLDVSSCETTNQIEIVQKNLLPRNSCPPRINSGDLRDQLQLLSEPKETITNLDYPINQTASSCEDSPDNSHSVTSSSCSISVPGLLAEDFKTIETDSNYQDFVEVSLFGSSPPASPKCNEEEESAYNQQGAKPKKKGIGNFLTRNLFPRLSGGKSKKISAPDGNHKEEWTPFGRMQVKDMPDMKQKGYTHPPTGSTSWKNRHASLGVASSTTALIFENRPGNLPAKNADEEQRHRYMYDQMVKGAKKKEKELAKQLAKNHVQQAKLDQKVHNSLTVWNKDILPNFESVKHQKKTKELWWNGVPPSVRGKVWIMAVGNDLNITHELFEIFKDRAKDTLKLFKEPDAEKVHKASREASMELIKLDVSRTFPHLCIFQKGGPYYDMLHSILGAYACYRPDVGYVQGMSFIAAVFLLNLEPPDAFICFSNLMNKPCQMAFFRLDQTIMQAYFATFEEYFQDNLPHLYDYFEELEVTPDLYIIDWMYTIYSKSLPLDVACRVWDVFFRDGEEFLFRTALGILQLYQNVLLGMDFIHIAQFLTRLPEDIASGLLFKSIAAIDVHQKKFSQVLSAHLVNQQQKQQQSDG